MANYNMIHQQCLIDIAVEIRRVNEVRNKGQVLFIVLASFA